MPGAIVFIPGSSGIPEIGRGIRLKRRIDMNKQSIVLAVSCAVFAAGMRAGESYQIVPAEGSRMELQVEKTGFLRGKKHTFLFERYEGSLQYNPEKPETSTVHIKIEARSASCKDTWVSANDLRKIQEYALKDMLAAEQHPYIEFTSTEIRSSGPGRFQANGNLTIRGIAKPSTAAVFMEPRGTELLISGTATVRMTDYGLKPPTAALGTIGTKPEMAFAFTLVARKAKNTTD
jgi:polyisoprenoid-binding protein YceI